MPVRYTDIVAQYGSDVVIPDHALYEYITSQEVKQEILIARKGRTLDEFKKIALVSEVRRRAKSDLFWFAKYFIGYNNKENDKMTEATHRRVCDFFVKKDTSKPFAEQDFFHERLLLYPRGAFKSTIDSCDTAQWILNFPNIRILYLTAAKTGAGTKDALAPALLDELKGHFKILEEEPSLMNLYFPEFCMEEKDLTGPMSFTTPQRTGNIKEPTILASSVGSTLAGFHFDLGKVDDAVADQNSNNEEQCHKTATAINKAKKTLMAYGFWDLVGTRYDDFDAYGDRLEKNVGEIKKSSDHPCCELIENLTTGFKALIGKAIVVKPEHEGKSYVEAGEQGVYLLFPEYLSYKFLVHEYPLNEVVFEGQYNQNPRPKTSIAFSKALLQKHTVPFTQLPTNGPISITWDFAFSVKKNRDYTVAAVGIYNEKCELYIIDLVRNRFDPTGLAKAFVDLAEKWKPTIIGVETVAGSKLIEPAIIHEANRRGKPWLSALCARVDWFAPDGQKDAKRMRIMSLHPWLTSDRLFFASHLPNLEALYSEFERCLSSHHHEDIPDVIAHQLRYAPRIAAMIAKKEVQTWSRTDIGWSQLFDTSGDLYGGMGPGSYTPPGSGMLLENDSETGQLTWRTEPVPHPITPPVSEEETTEKSDNGGLDNVLGSGLFG